MSQQNPQSPLDKNKALGAAAGTAGIGAVLTGINIEVVAQIWPAFVWPPYEMMGVTLAWGVVGAYLGAFFAKHNIAIPGAS